MNATLQNDTDSDDNGLMQVVSFALSDELFALPMTQVLEIMRYPEPVKVPLTPPSLLGLAGVRGSVSPIVDLRALLGMGQGVINEASRVLLLDMGQSVGMVVDRVDRVLTLERHQIESASDINSIDTELLTGVYRLEGDEKRLLQLLDLDALMAREFSADSESDLVGAMASIGTAANQAVASIDDNSELTQLVSIEVDGQEYAFRLNDVQEVLRYPDSISHTPKAPAHVIGLMTRRGKPFPLFSLRALLSLAPVEAVNEQVVVVLRRGQVRLALAVDQVKEVVRLEEKRLEPVPEVLARDPGMQDVAAICRLDEGRRLLSLLATDPLFSDAGALALEDPQTALQQRQEQDVMAHDVSDEQTDECQLVVFTLEEQQYGISIEQVQEITRLPERFYHVPKSPDFIEGMMNLRGTVLPVVDMRARFGLARIEHNERQRILVLNLNGVTTGFVVDTVSEVRRLQRHTIEAAPRLSAAQQKLLGEVVRTPDNQLVQLLNVDALMSHDEQQALVESAEAGEEIAATAS
ncbi:chemotaxis protein CheW [Vreelandella aquamarina]|uniref:chemotaxis protein CheW n=1 Tax=Vreelandella aquamarina TaxID=77097 RepID=UPI00384FF7AE